MEERLPLLVIIALVVLMASLFFFRAAPQAPPTLSFDEHTVTVHSAHNHIDMVFEKKGVHSVQGHVMHNFVQDGDLWDMGATQEMHWINNIDYQTLLTGYLQTKICAASYLNGTRHIFELIPATNEVKERLKTLPDGEGTQFTITGEDLTVKSFMYDGTPLPYSEAPWTFFLVTSVEYDPHSGEKNLVDRAVHAM